MKSGLLVIVLVLLNFFNSYADSNSWITFTAEDGLASGRVLSISQDSQGIYWFGTVSGLSRYDGDNWTTYTNTHGLSNNKVDAIAIGSQDNVWVGYEREGVGISKFDGISWNTWTQSNGLPLNSVYSIAIDSKNNVWVGFAEEYEYEGEGICMFDGTNWTTHKVSYPDFEGNQNYIKAIAEDAQGNMWFGTILGLSKYDGNDWTIYNTSNGLLSHYVNDISVDSQDNVWVATLDGGVSKFDGTNWINYTTEDGLSKDRVYAIEVDAQDNVWVGYEHWGRPVGVDKFDGNTWFNYTTSDGLADDYVHTIYTDKNGYVWFGTHEGGVCRISTSPDIYIFPDSISFIDIAADTAGIANVTITNKGNESLVISDISSDNEQFKVNPFSNTIGPGQSQIVTISCRANF